MGGEGVCGVCAVVVVAEAGEGKGRVAAKGGSVRKKALLILVVRVRCTPQKRLAGFRNPNGR